jgi:Flp pilus assembly protein TadD
VIALKEERLAAADDFFTAIHYDGAPPDVQNGLAVTKIVEQLDRSRTLDASGTRILEEAATKYPEYGDLLVNLGTAHLYAGKPEQAASRFQKALETRNVSWDGLVYLYNGLGSAFSMMAE